MILSNIIKLKLCTCSFKRDDENDKVGSDITKTMGKLYYYKLVLCVQIKIYRRNNARKNQLRHFCAIQRNCVVYNK